MIPEWVAKYIGLPYEDLGRGPAFDCYGLVWHIMRDHYGIEIPIHADIHPEDDSAIRARAVQGGIDGDNWISVPEENAQCGDGIVLRIMGRPWHCGLVVEKGWMVHIHRGIDTVLVRYDQTAWARRIDGIYRRPELHRA